MFEKGMDESLPYEIEHIYPDYSIYPEKTKDTAYGYLTRGCPRGCDFCHVKDKEGTKSYKVADLNEFWRGQKHIELMDPNILACKDWKDLLQQIADSGAKVNFNQGLDIRLMTEEKAEMISKCDVSKIHFAWDRIEDAELIKPKLEKFCETTRISKRNIQVYVLCGDREKKVLDADLERIQFIRELGASPFVMLYDKEHIPKGHDLRRLQRWVNNRFIFWSVKTFEEYKA